MMETIRFESIWIDIEMCVESLRTARLAQWMSDCCAADSIPVRKQIFVWPPGSCSGSCLGMYKRTHDRGIILSA